MDLHMINNSRHCPCAQKQKRRHFHTKTTSAKLYMYIGVGPRDLYIDEAHMALDIFCFAAFFLYICINRSYMGNHPTQLIKCIICRTNIHIQYIFLISQKFINTILAIGLLPKFLKEGKSSNLKY